MHVEKGGIPLLICLFRSLLSYSYVSARDVRAQTNLDLTVISTDVYLTAFTKRKSSILGL